MQGGTLLHINCVSTAAYKTEIHNGKSHYSLLSSCRSLQFYYLTSCDFWLWGYLKSKVYQGIVQDLVMLKDSISRIVREIPSDMLLSAFVTTGHRMQYVVHNIETDLNELNKK